MNETGGFLTILTPTYNRAGMLPRLYESLLAQTSPGFDWLVVDDGSDDGTQVLVEGWCAEGKLPIRYLRRENGGKHRALNTGIQQVDAPLTFIVDSDDTLLPGAVATVAAMFDRYGLRADLCGYSFLRVSPNGASLAAKPLPEGDTIATFAKVRMHDNNPGDMAEVWFTHELREHPFLEFPGEKFYSESGVWLRISGEKKVVFTNTPIYICEYYADGLTRNRTKTQKASPRGVLDVSLLLMGRPCGLRWNVRGALRYCVFAHMLGMSLPRMARQSGRPLLVWLCALPSVLLRRRWK